jgi:hypothetical protein
MEGHMRQEKRESMQPTASDVDDGPGSGALFELLDVQLDDFLDILNILYVFHNSLLLL